MNPRPDNPTRHLREWLLWPVTLLVLLLLFAAAPGIAAVRATLDRDTIYMGDIFTLIIENSDRSSDQQPDLTPLEKDFEILGTRTSTQVRIFNGQRSDKIQWHVQLQPRRPGQLHIPSINVSGQQTFAIELTISNPPQQTTAQIGQHIFIETETNTGDKPVYVQQQIPYTVRLYYDNRLQNGELSTPAPENAVVEQMGKDKRYDTVRNGRQYRVIERNYVISAEKSGKLNIPPVAFRGRIAVAQQGQRIRRPRSPIEEFLSNSRFANDPFFRNGPDSNPFSNPGQPITIRSQSIDMQIQPRPATAGYDWLPAEEVILHDSWTENAPQFRVDEPVSRTIVLQTRGLSGSQTPELSIDTPTDSRLYPETSTAESRTDGITIYGVRTQTLTYIPGKQGMLDIPAITLEWWDTGQNKPASTTLPAWQFNVLPSDPGSVSETQATTVTNTDDDKTVQTDQRWLMTGSGILLALVLLLSIWVWRVKQRYPNRATIRKKIHSPNWKIALRNLQRACTANDRHATAQALLSLARIYWPDDPPHSLAALAARIGKGQTELHELDRSLYAVDAENWKGDTLWNEFRHSLPKKKATGKYQDGGLKPLYPNSL